LQRGWILLMSVEGLGHGNTPKLNIERRVSQADTNNKNGDFSGILNSAMSEQTTDLDQIFAKASQKYNVPLGLLKAVAKAESGFNPLALSRCGAQGIMQLMPATARSLGVTNPFDPEQNIMGGAKYLSQMLKRFDGNTQLALAAYNAGPGNVSKYGGIPPFKETQNYVRKALAYSGGDLSAGTVPNLPGRVSVPASGEIPPGEDMPAALYDPTLRDSAVLIEIRQYEMQKSLLAMLDSNDSEREER